MKKIKIGVVSLGCDKNRVDSEVMLKRLSEKFTITNNPEEADVIIVNTCAFLESSRQEAIDTALEMSQYKQGNCKKVILTGCLGQKFGKEVFDGLTEVDVVVGTNNYDDIVDIVERSLTEDRFLCVNDVDGLTHGERILTTPSHYAYLKIADGCNNFCTYCLIPHIRGRFRSVPMDEVIDEAKELVGGGVKEIILVAQDTTRYGFDLYGESKIVELIRKLSNIDGLKWIRLLYCYPELMTDALIDEIATNDKVVKYVDIPLQHVDDGILLKMNRRSSEESIRLLFDKLSKNGIYVRSTFICGFPGENGQTVDKLDKFLRKNKLRNVGFFAFSPEEGTPAFSFDNQLDTESKDKIVERLYTAQHGVVEELNDVDIGKTYEVVIDDFVEDNQDGYVYVGRTSFMSPDIDGVVYVYSNEELQIGSFVNVRITDALEYDLIGDKV